MELRINNSCYKAFRYGDIDYVHRLCGPKVSEDDDDVNAMAAADVMCVCVWVCVCVCCNVTR